ncbi:hypothetical protein Dda_6816 [Drechslerella dactyloides]|uniref:Uncharacterized protein n=1 Tax=Drechslerella dactyloides TaxID=74499 RepID=A0AAD6IUE2_DREDA|nr:hypothetical protein Dda_6816 [Drechslerella dactyloides]
MVQREAPGPSSLFLLDDDDVSRVHQPVRFKFLEQGNLSAEQQLVVHKARTPQGHAQDWAAFELADGTKLGNARLHWRTKYVSVAPSPQSPGSKPLPSKMSANVPQFFLDLFYFSPNRKYRFAVRVDRAEISSISEKADQFLLLNLTKATEWNPPKGCDYEQQPEKPGTWLSLPVTLKLRAKNAESFTQFAAETTVICRSQNFIIWSPTLGERHLQAKADAAAAAPRKRSEGLNRLAARLQGRSPQQDSKNPFLYDAPPETAASRRSTPTSTSSIYSSTDEAFPDERVKADGAYEPCFIRRDSTPSVFEDTAGPFRMGPFTPQWDRNATPRPPTGWLPNANALKNPPLATPPKTPILAQKRGAPSPSISPQSSRVFKKTKCDERVSITALTRSNTLEDGEILESQPLNHASPAPAAPHDVAFLQAKLRSQEMAQAFKVINDAAIALTRSAAVPPVTNKQKAVPSRVENVADDGAPPKPDPSYRFIGTGRNLDEEFGRKLTLEESILAQWLEESDKRLGRTGPMTLERVSAVVDECSDGDDASMDISPISQSPA